MERDMDLIRNLVLKIAANPKLDGTHHYKFDASDNLGDYSEDQIAYHIDLLFEAGFVDGSPRSEFPLVSKLTWKGHEFADNIRDNGIWKSVKTRIAGLPSVAITVVAELALHEVKKKLGIEK